ncbi:immunoglobulin-like and fibronectin type III domain-containing protein 1 [Polyodon spathula]|uniref:immunoglobulin-like and fibronectin type III domain-containing protein 1 n=1 Tax=Polyodon spathula TaxID=7913 RepID=UPI001B7E5F5E|nr:immunoglobulin-like and fibronectin type III domain-containing protein 1 [Polyodon spathula]
MLYLLCSEGHVTILNWQGSGPRKTRAGTKKKSRMAGVKITQFTEDIPKGCSTPDFERKPIPLTIQEGKTAIFKAVPSGDPKPEVTWRRAKGDMDDPKKFKFTYDKVLNEYSLQVIKANGDDADTYRCYASNEYGEAVCTVTLIIIELGLKKKTKPETNNAGSKDPTEFRKLLKKTTCTRVKQEKMSEEKMWELLMSADKKDYERICIEYGYTDFRGMLTKLNLMKKEREEEQAKYIEAISNLRHIQVNSEGSAEFEIEMELKDLNSRIFLYKDGVMIPYSTDMEMKHNLKKFGKKYIFSINSLMPEDAGLYQVDVESTNVFSTDLPTKFIPVNFASPLKEVKCKERDDVMFECIITHPLPKLVWMFKNKQLEAGEKFQFAVSEDKLTHRMVVKDVMPVDKGIYSVAAGIRSSSAWLLVETEESMDPSIQGKKKPKKGQAIDINAGLTNQPVDGILYNFLKSLGDGSGAGDGAGLGSGGQNSTDGLDGSDGLGKEGAGMGGKGGLGDGQAGQGGMGDGKGGMAGLGIGKGSLGDKGELGDGKGSLGGGGLGDGQGSLGGKGGQLGLGDGQGGIGGKGGQMGLGDGQGSPGGKGGQGGLGDGQGSLGGKGGQMGLGDGQGGLGGKGGQMGLGDGQGGLGGKGGQMGLGDGQGSLGDNSKWTGRGLGDGGQMGLGDGQNGIVGKGGQMGLGDGQGSLGGKGGQMGLGDGQDGIVGKGGQMGLGVLGNGSGAKAGRGLGDGSVLGKVGAGGLGVDGTGSGLGGSGLSGDGTGQGGLGRSGHSGSGGKDGSALDVSGLTDDQNRKNRRAGRGPLIEDTITEPVVHFTRGLFDIQARKGHSAELACALSSAESDGTWFKDGVKLQSSEGLSVCKDGSVHKLVFSNIQDSDAGKYRFEAEGHKTESHVVVTDPPEIDKEELARLAKEPLVVKAGQNAAIKVPFSGRPPFKVSWYKDADELSEDNRTVVEKGPDHTRLLIGKCQRKDSGELKLKLKNESGTAEAVTKLIVLDKPTPPQGPVEVLDSSANRIEIKWRPPRDNGGKPIEKYILERQQVGRNTWMKMGEVSGDTTTFATDKVEHGKKYCFRIWATSTEGISDALETDDITAGTKAFPGPPAPPKVVATSCKSITLSWSPPHNTGGTRIACYILEKRKKGSSIWSAATEEPIKGLKHTVTDVVEGMQYEFRVAAVNVSGTGEPSVPSDFAFARDPMKPPGMVNDFKVTDSTYTTLSLSWSKPSTDAGDEAKGYYVEVMPEDSGTWLRYNSSPTNTTSYTIKGLKSMQMYFVRVIAVNDGGLGEPKELDNYIIAMPPPVRPRFLNESSLKSFMVVKAGNTIRVNINFEASPIPDVIWMKGGSSVSKRATITNADGLSQLLIPTSEHSDSGVYTIMVKNYFGQECFSFEICVTDDPKPPGPVELDEKVPGTVTISWEPSPDEKRDEQLHYLVMKRDSSKPSWHMVADNIFNNKFTAVIVSDRQYYFRVFAKNDIGISTASDSPAWGITKQKEKFTVKMPIYKQTDPRQAPKFTIRLKNHTVPRGYPCNMSCAVKGNPAPTVTWYRNNISIMDNAQYYTSNICGVCSMLISNVSPKDSGEYSAIAENCMGRAECTTRLNVTE